MHNPLSDGDDAGIPFANDSTRTPENIRFERKQVLTGYGIALAVQVSIYALTYICAPGYIVPLLNHPVARLIILLLLFWETVAAVTHWYLAPTTNLNKLALQIPTTLFIFVPGFFFPLLGPACVAIMDALRPVLSTK